MTANIERQIFLNGEPVSTTAATLEQLLAEQGFLAVKVATALNGSFVPARARKGQTLSEGDHIEVVSARQGG